MRSDKILLTALLALACNATQAQQKDVRVLTKGSSFKPIPKMEENRSCIEWYSTENSWQKDENTNWAENIPINNGIEKEFDMISNLKRQGLNPICWQLAEEPGQTVMHCYLYMPADTVMNIWLASKETAILDCETGIQYRAKGATEGCWERHFSVKSAAGNFVDMQIFFPALPQKVKKIAIYGIPLLEMRGDKFTLNRTRNGENSKQKYDKTPRFHTPRLVKAAQNYDKDNPNSWSVYTDTHLIKPTDEKTMAIWLTPEATYVAIAKEQNWMREYYGLEPDTRLIDNETGENYKMRSIQGLPTGQIFWIEGYSGDYQAFVLEFEPLPPDVTSITYLSPDSEPFKAWGANWKGEIRPNLDVETLRANQPLFEYHKRTIAR